MLDNDLETRLTKTLLASVTEEDVAALAQGVTIRDSLVVKACACSPLASSPWLLPTCLSTLLR